MRGRRWSSSARRQDRLDDLVRQMASAGGQRSGRGRRRHRSTPTCGSSSRVRRGVRPARRDDLQRRHRLSRRARRHTTGRDATARGRQSHGHHVRRCRGTAGVPAPAAGTHHRDFIDRRTPRHRRHERVLGDEGGADRVRSRACGRNSQAPTSTPPSSTPSRRRRPSSGRRFTAITAARSAGKGPRQSADSVARLIVECVDLAESRGLHGREVEMVRRARRRCPGAHGSVGEAIRPASRAARSRRWRRRRLTSRWRSLPKYRPPAAGR